MVVYFVSHAMQKDTMIEKEIIKANMSKPLKIYLIKNKKNVGLTKGSNQAIDLIKEKIKPGFIGKVDPDCLFLTKGWLEAYVDMFKRNCMLYISSFPEGLVDHPGGSWRQGFATLGGEYIEIVDHLSGICAFIDAKAYNNFRWTDKFLHGQQDGEASAAFNRLGYMPMIMPRHRIQHMDTTVGQKERYPEYFERRKHEKTTQV
jgi:GT2 family glycosyltransferase